MSTSFPSLTKTWHTTSYPSLDPKRPELTAKGKTVIITGGSSTSIGAAIALSFAQAGAEKIAILGRTEKTLLETKSTVEASYPSTKVLVKVADITSPESVGSVAHQIRAEFGAWDVLVSNAGYLPDMTSLTGADFDDWWKAFETNIRFAQFFAKHFLTKCRPDATYVSLSSGIANANAKMMTGMSAYSASKLAVLKVNEFLAAENPSLRVFNVHPGVIDTPMSQKLLSQSQSGRKLTLSDASLSGDFIVWLASAQSEFLRGRLVWANWDVDELVAVKDKIEADPQLLTPTIGGWPFKPLV